MGGEYDGEGEEELVEEVPMGQELPPELPPAEGEMMAEGGMPGELPPEMPVEEMPV